MHGPGLWGRPREVQRLVLILISWLVLTLAPPCTLAVPAHCLPNNTELCWHMQGSLLRSRGTSKILDLYPSSATGQPCDSRGISSLCWSFPHLKKMRDLNEATQDCFQAQYSVQTTLDPCIRPLGLTSWTSEINFPAPENCFGRLQDLL